MTVFRLCIILFLILHIVADARSQDDANVSPRAARIYKQALEQYSKRDFESALKTARRAYSADPNFVRAYLLAGDISNELKDDASSISYYEKAVAISPDYYPPAYYILGNLYFRFGRYEEAYKNFDIYAGFELPPDERLIVEQRLENAAVARDLKNNPVPFDPINLCNNINTPNSEFVNSISADGQMLIFTVRSPQQSPDSRRQFREAFYVSTLVNGQWAKAQPLTFLPGTTESEGALALSYDNRYIFFTSCHRPDGYGSCDLYYSRKVGSEWLKPINLGPVVNSSRWESQPSFSSDGRTLYFASNRPGGFGGSDIWKTVLQPDGTWGKPENLGPVINTSSDEMSPYIHADGQTLYFSSRGHFGLGGADLFVSRLLPDKSWSEPLNLGYPINTKADEINLIVDPEGMNAYISSDIPGGKGGYDIYKFSLYDEIKPLPVSYVKGIIRHATTLRPMEASVDLLSLKDGQKIIETLSDAVSGEFFMVLPTGLDYALNVNKQCFLFYSHHFALDNVTTYFDPVILDIYLKPIEYDQRVVLRNVFFAHDSYLLEPISKVELDKLVDLLNENPDINLEISGHTDNTGTSAYNLNLSTNRARAVYEYIIESGVNEERLKYIGKGELEPIDTNDTVEGRANNRRTEFRIIKN